MKKITIVLMAACFALSANAFAASKHHVKHKHHAKPVAAAPAVPASPSETPAK
jgi:hypothetical protein